ncbi:hypothetical protein GGQ65_005759 [Rhizobium fabae]|uniref:Uncharacterized protein n=1 Tax=Rhizobium fabae TaxID=573179 RepID=A0A7W6BJ99_9HYPH|nr:hypothetical protein [Rhizobium fabae]
MHHPQLQHACGQPAESKQKEVWWPDSGGSSREEDDDGRDMIIALSGLQQNSRDEEAAQNKEETNADVTKLRAFFPEMRIKHRQQCDRTQSV